MESTDGAIERWKRHRKCSPVTQHLLMRHGNFSNLHRRVVSRGYALQDATGALARPGRSRTSLIIEVMDCSNIGSRKFNGSLRFCNSR